MTAVASRRASPPRTSRSLLGVLEAFGERSGSALGAIYALAAGSVLSRVERLEDLNAERRYRERSQASRSEIAAAGLGSPPNESLQPPR